MSISSLIANDKLTELRNKKKLAIQALDFDAAQKYDEQIQEQNEQIISERIEKIKSEISKDLREHIQKYRKIRNEINEYNQKTESQLNATYQDLIDKTQIQHGKELRSIDKSHGIALLREAEREVPDQIELLEKAKAAAVAGRYDDARDLRDQARAAGENELEERKKKIDKEFEHSRSMLAAKQQEAIEHITQKYDDEISNLTGEIQMRIKETEQRFESGVDLIRQRAEIRCNSLVADDEVKEEAIFNIKQMIDEIIRDSQQKPPPTSLETASQNLQQKRSASRSSRSSSSVSSTANSPRNKNAGGNPNGSAGNSNRLGQMSSVMARKLTGAGSASSSAQSSSRRQKPPNSGKKSSQNSSRLSGRSSGQSSARGNEASPK